MTPRTRLTSPFNVSRRMTTPFFSSSGRWPSWRSAATRCCGRKTRERPRRSSRARGRRSRICSRSSRAGTSSSSCTATDPQVGNLLIQSELAAAQVPPQTLDFCVAQTQGSLGFLLELAFANELSARRVPQGGRARSSRRCRWTPRTRPSSTRPSRSGLLLARAAAVLEKDPGWMMAEDSGRGWRKVVRLPQPSRSAVSRSPRRSSTAGTSSSRPAEAESRSSSPTTEQVRGVEAVIDKDYTASMLAVVALRGRLHHPDGCRVCGPGLRQARTDADPGARRRGGPRRSLAEGQFPPGSMGPKIDAAARFVEAGGRQVLITRAESLAEALEGPNGNAVEESGELPRHPERSEGSAITFCDDVPCDRTQRAEISSPLGTLSQRSFVAALLRMTGL